MQQVTLAESEEKLQRYPKELNEALREAVECRLRDAKR